MVINKVRAVKSNLSPQIMIQNATQNDDVSKITEVVGIFKWNENLWFET